MPPLRLTVFLYFTVFHKGSISQAVKDRRLGLLLMIPVVIVVFIIMGLPFIRAIYWSFTDKVIGAEANFIGFDNYIKLFSDKIYWKSLTNTLVYTVVCIVAKLLIGLLWAVLLNQNFKGKGFFRTALLIPWALPGRVAAMTWRWMYDSTYGIINSLLMDMGIIDLPIAWLSNPKIVLFSAIIVNIWRGVPFFMFSILGELQTLDRQVYEAATVDGAGIFKQFLNNSGTLHFHRSHRLSKLQHCCQQSGHLMISKMYGL